MLNIYNSICSNTQINGQQYSGFIGFTNVAFGFINSSIVSVMINSTSPNIGLLSGYTSAIIVTIQNSVFNNSNITGGNNIGIIGLFTSNCKAVVSNISINSHQSNGNNYTGIFIGLASSSLGIDIYDSSCILS